MSEAVATTGIMVQRADYVAPVGITSSSVASASVITTSGPHGLTTGDTATITGHAGSTPIIDGDHIATVLSPTTFSIPVNVTVAGAGGSVLAIGEFVTVAEVIKATPPGFSRNKIETSTHNEGFESFILGIIRQRDPAFSINLVGGEDTHEQLFDDFLGNVKAWWRYLFPSGITYTGPARVQQFNMADAPVDAAQQADIVLAWAGQAVRSQAA